MAGGALTETTSLAPDLIDEPNTPAISAASHRYSPPTLQLHHRHLCLQQRTVARRNVVFTLFSGSVNGLFVEVFVVRGIGDGRVVQGSVGTWNEYSSV